MALQPESIFHVVWLVDADAPAGNALFYTAKDALELVARLHDMPSVSVYEHHPEKGKRTVLEYAPWAGLVAAGPYQTWEQRWRPGYSAEKVRSWLKQYPSKIRPGWVS